MQIFVVLTLTNTGSGKTVRMSGKTKPDRYLFNRVDGLHHLHRMELPLDEYRKIKGDLLNQPLPFPVDVDFRYEVEPGDLDTAAQDRFDLETSELRKEIEARNEQIKALEAERSELQSQLAQAGDSRGELTDEQKGFLEVHDALLNELADHANEDETPVECLKRILHEWEHPTKRKGKKKAEDKPE